MELLFNPTMEVFKYIVMTIMLSATQQQVEMQWGIVELNNKKSPGLIGTATPRVGKQK